METKEQKLLYHRRRLWLKAMKHYKSSWINQFSVCRLNSAWNIPADSARLPYETGFPVCSGLSLSSDSLAADGAPAALWSVSITGTVLTSVFLCVCPQPPVREGPVTRSASRAASLHSLSDASSDSFNHSPGELAATVVVVRCFFALGECKRKQQTSNSSAPAALFGFSNVFKFIRTCQ